MKKHIILATALCATLTAGAQMMPDTVLRVDDAKKLLLLESPEGLKVEVQGNGKDTVIFQPYEPDATVTSHQSAIAGVPIPKFSTSDGRWDVTSGGLGLGMVQATGKPAGMRTEMAKSFEIQWLNILAVRFAATRSTKISLGVGVDWRNYRMTQPTVAFVPLPGHERGIGLGTYPEGVQAKWSRIKTFSVGFPLMIRQQLPFNVLGKSRFSITAGAVFNINTFGSIKSCYVLDGNDTKRYADNVDLRRFTVDLMGIVSIAKDLGVYVRYSPMTVLEEPSLQFHPLSCGLILGF